MIAPPTLLEVQMVRRHRGGEIIILTVSPPGPEPRIWAGQDRCTHAPVDIEYISPEVLGLAVHRLNRAETIETLGELQGKGWILSERVQREYPEVGQL
ncbi:MAG TPA: hypothetical protein PKJ51_07610 [Methanothrix sp.]|nr:hypothetical protein [Methanothrix sp.]